MAQFNHSKCKYVAVTATELYQCNAATPGGDYCLKHAQLIADIEYEEERKKILGEDKE
jgi:hypothetical protein